MPCHTVPAATVPMARLLTTAVHPVVPVLQLRTHTFSLLEDKATPTLTCVECEELATHRCHDCEENYCDSCYDAIHAKSVALVRCWLTVVAYGGDLLFSGDERSSTSGSASLLAGRRVSSVRCCLPRGPVTGVRIRSVTAAMPAPTPRWDTLNAVPCDSCRALLGCCAVVCCRARRSPTNLLW